MRVLVDTSAWIEFFNHQQSAVALVVARLLRDEVELVTCGLVVSEFLQGLRPGPATEELRAHFLEMRWLQPREPETYLAAADLFQSLRARGTTIRSTVDCLIAILAAENDALLLSRDRDLTRIYESDLIKVRAVPV